MSTNFYEIKSKAAQKQLDDAKSAEGTGYVHFDQDVVLLGFKTEYFFINGNEVTKELFILNSGMEHLILDRSMIKCTQCGRSASPDKYKEKCGSDCSGIFF